MKVYIGSDHAGFELKNQLVLFLGQAGHNVTDMGPLHMNAEDDYPDILRPVAEVVAGEPGSFGIVLGGSGQGEAIVANRVRGARAALYDGGPLEGVKLSREHNDANILAIGARLVSEQDAMHAVTLFLSTRFSGESRHIRRIKKLDA